MRLPATFLNRQLPYPVPACTRLARKDLAGKPNGPKHKEHALRRDDRDLRQRGRTGLLQAVPESAGLQFASPKTIVYGHRGATLENGRKTNLGMRVGLYARVSTQDQQTIPMQTRALREYASRRGWKIALQVKEIGSGAIRRERREKLLEAARRREIDVVLVWQMDRWGRSVADLLATLRELEHLGVGFVSLTEALDLTTPAGRAMAGLLAVFAEFEREILRERVRAGLVHARQNGQRLGRPMTAALHADQVRCSTARARAKPPSPAD